MPLVHISSVSLGVMNSIDKLAPLNIVESRNIRESAPDLRLCEFEFRSSLEDDSEIKSCFFLI